MPHNMAVEENKDAGKQFNIKILADGKILLSMMGKDGFDDYAYDTIDEAFADIKADADLSGDGNDGQENKKSGKAMMDKLMNEGESNE